MPCTLHEACPRRRGRPIALALLLGTALVRPAAGQGCEGDPVADPIPRAIPTSPIVLALTPVASGLTAPTWGMSAPGVNGHLFVVDQSGVLWSVALPSGDRHAKLTVSDRLVDLGVFGPDSFDERGFLGVAFHPDYAANGLLYTYTSEPAAEPADFSTMPKGTEPNHHAVVTEWRDEAPGDPTAPIDSATARVLLRIAQPQFNHNAGALAFGPDGLLYIALGDGGGADDEDGQMFIGAPIIGHGSGNAQDRSNPLGSLLRIDPAGDDSANGQYGIPTDNPFVGEPGVVAEIWAYGFRNPFRMSFDDATGALWVADVGQNALEEIDIAVAGGNFGWNAMEGSFRFCTNGTEPGFVTDAPPPADMIAPVAEYDHDEGTAIIGGFVYRGTRVPPLAGRYVFGEFARTFSADGRLFHLDADDAIVEFQLHGAAALGVALLGFAQDDAGELYALGNTTGTPFGDTGVILRLGTRPGDIDGDGAVGVTDLLGLLGDWGRCAGCAADIDGDGMVAVSDLLALLAAWDV